LLLLIAASAVLIAPRQARPAMATAELIELIARASHWTARFDQSLSGLLFRERYTQRTTAGSVSAAVRSADRNLEANLFLLRVPSSRDFVVYRDVYRFNGRDLHDHTQRLEKLLLEGTASAHEQARRLTNASAQYNAPGFQRNINVPTMAYDYLAPWHVHKIRVRHSGVDRIEGLDVVMIDFEEFGRPTLVRGARDADVAGTGRFWIHPGSGAVPRAVAEFETESRNKGRLEVKLELHETLKIWVPKEMTEVWTGFNRRLTGLAHYDRFQRMAVATTETIK
jgi:hypothetical protein